MRTARRFVRNKTDSPCDLAVERHLVDPFAALEQPLQAAGVHNRAGKKMRARRLPFLEHRHRNLAEALGRGWILLDQLSEPDRRREPRGAGTDDEEPDVDALVDRIGRRRDRVGR